MTGDVTLGALKRFSTLMAGQSKSAVAITGGTIDGVTIGATTPPAATIKLAYPIESGTTAANFVNYGITQFGSTAAKTFTLAPPVTGIDKILYVNVSSTAIQTIQCDSLSTFGLASSSFTKLAVDPNTAKDATISLTAASATKWIVQGITSTAITITT